MSIVELVINPKLKDLGEDMKVRRAIPDIRKKYVGPFVFWDHMGPIEIAPGKELNVRSHPHIGLATITYLFAGEIMHRDSLGNELLIRPGEVNWMTAGKGIAHSERSTYKGCLETLEGIQLWVALPKEKEDVEPNFSHFKEDELPVVQTQGHVLRLIAGSSMGKASAVPVYSDLFYFRGESTKGSVFKYQLDSNQEAAIYVLNGDLSVEGITYKRYDLIIFKQGSNIEFSSFSKTDYMFFGGSVFPEKRHVWWNFVSSEKEKIELAKQKWKDGKFGTVINESEFIPLPE